MASKQFQQVVINQVDNGFVVNYITTGMEQMHTLVFLNWNAVIAFLQGRT